MLEKELLLLSHFREDARKPLTKISKETRIPVSTIFDKLRKFEDTIITRTTALLNFPKLGYDIRANITLKVGKEDREPLKEFLMKNRNVNSLFKVNNDFDYLIEVVFQNMTEFHQFTESLETFKIEQKREHFILEDLKREAFLSVTKYPQLISPLQNGKSP